MYGIYDSSTQKSISQRQQNLIFCMGHEMVVSEIDMGVDDLWLCGRSDSRIENGKPVHSIKKITGTACLLDE